MKPERVSFNIPLNETKQIKLHSEIIRDNKTYIITMIKMERDSADINGNIIYNSEIKAEEKWFYFKRIRIKCHYCEDLENLNCNYETCIKE
jgi:hypothetical protein